MKRFLPEKKTLARFEFAAAILLTLVSLAFHLIFFLHAGPLWRDEISSLALATKPTLTEFWRCLAFDPFPASYFLLLRSWHAIGFGESDLALRELGLLIGALLVGSFWLSSYLIDKSPPVWPLALFALNPLTLEAGDSLRPYGFGLIWIVLAFGLIGRITFNEPGKRSALFALLAVLLSVQSIFTNAFIFFAIAVAAAGVLLQKRAWQRMTLILGIGVLAALSLTPYLPIMQATHDWAKIIGNENDVASVVAVGRDAIADAGVFAKWTWLAVGSALAAALASTLVFGSRLRAIVDLNRDRIIFAGISVLVGAAATIGFLCAVRYLVFPRYFLAVMAMATLCVNILWNAISNRLAVRTLSLFLALVVAATSLRSLSERANMRMTNCDKVAAALEQRASADDLIILTSFLYGVSFQRYYHGRTNWVALPQVDDFSLHRWDLLKQAMARPDPVPDLLSRAESVLQAGHKVFLVGKLGPPPAVQPESLPPAPQSEFVWQMEPYLNQWKSELTYWLEHHALHGNNLTMEERQSVNPLEHLGLFEVFGWREN